MNKNIVTPIFFILLVLTLIYNISTSNRKIDNFFNLHKNVGNLIATDKNLDIFIINNSKYKNFDYIQKDIALIQNNIDYINENELFIELSNDSLKRQFTIIRDNMKTKIEHVYKMISKTAVLNNSFRYMRTLQTDFNNRELLSIYTKVVGINYDVEIDIEQLHDRLYKYKAQNKEEKLFISHAKIIVNYYYSFKKLQSRIISLKIGKKLASFEKNLSGYSTSIITGLKDVIWVLAMVIFISMLVFLYSNYMIKLKQDELNRFRNAVENSDNIVLITDKDEKIKYANEVFEKSTGYTLKEVIGKKPSFLKSYQQPESFYKELSETIHAGKRWQGEFINKNKDGKIAYEKASITPILNDDGEIEEFLAIKLDITKEKETDEVLKQKEKLLSQQSKMVAMREMLESIAHQWRQPLSTISTAASGINLNKEYESLSDDKLSEYMKVIVENTQYLSKTIDNFKNYFNTNNEKTIFNLEDTINKVLDLVGYRLNETKTSVIVNSEEVLLEGLENEFIQAIMNIVNNSLEAFERNEVEKRFIFIDVLKESNSMVLRIKDNAGGIKNTTLDKVFEPYFTTKHQSLGTGMGLYMVHEIVMKHFKGEVGIENTQYEFKNKHYKGVQIIIHTPFSTANVKTS